ncbi:MAG: hypothetical protein HY940_07990 [Gammaproteobacteria bacterium]|nr:hypothetical protein [Gammaproteobacteria bacterium]
MATAPALSPPPTACYVSGKGMYASNTTWSFKASVILALEQSGLGFDTRYRYYCQQFPAMEASQLARMICDPMEYYDRNFPAYLAQQQGRISEAEAATRFMLTLDDQFRQQAEVAIYCLDEAGFGSGVNIMRFLTRGKPLLGFYNLQRLQHPLNLSNILQLQLHYPELVTLISYQDGDDLPQQVLGWLQGRHRG